MVYTIGDTTFEFTQSATCCVRVPPANCCFTLELLPPCVHLVMRAVHGYLVRGDTKHLNFPGSSSLEAALIYIRAYSPPQRLTLTKQNKTHTI